MAKNPPKTKEEFLKIKGVNEQMIRFIYITIKTLYIIAILSTK